MKYKSELINEIVENRGHCSPSLHYESECIEKWIEETKGSYPKLCDYESEWLNYYLENDGIGKFPYLALDNISSTTIENTVPIPFKSAVLKGNTIKTSKLTWSTGKYLNNITGNLVEGKETHKYSEEFFECEPNTIYEVIGDNNYKKLCFYDTKKTFIKGYSSDTVKFDSLKQQSPSNACYLRISTSLTASSELTSEPSEELTLYNHSLGISVIGTNIEDKILSVKMPVLKTTGKNLYNPSEAFIGGVRLQNVCYSINVKPNQPYTFYTNGKTWATAILYDKNDNETRRLGNSVTTTMVTFTPSNNELKVELSYYTGSDGNVIDDIDFTGVQLEEGSIATSYEPYKSNILTVNEDVTLRGIGDVKDELDLMTGEVVQSVGVLNGEEVGWNIEGISQKPTDSSLIAFSIDLIKSPNKNLLSSVLVESGDVNKPYRWHVSFDTWLTITLPKTEVTNLAEFKAWIKNNETLYPLTEKSIKTVDLSIIDETGASVSKLKAMNGITHIETNGTPLTPTFSGEIPVEAITQNLNSFIEEE